MRFRLSSFIQNRPYLYHLTHRENLPMIGERGSLVSAASLAIASGNTESVRTKRAKAVSLLVNGHAVYIRDQAPLHQGNLELSSGWNFEDFLEDLNRRVFFWPGTAVGPSPYGIRHYERYAEDDPAIIRVRTDELMRINRPKLPQFCRFNSGSPRCSNGRKSPRGPKTFQEPAEFVGSISKVVEVTYVDRVKLPKLEVGTLVNGEWRRAE